MAHELVREAISASLPRLESELNGEVSELLQTLEFAAQRENRIAELKERIGAYRLFLGLVPAQDQ